MPSGIQEHVDRYRAKRDLNAIVPEVLRRIPALWNDETQQAEEYYSHFAFTREYEIHPHRIAHQCLSRYFDPRWAESGILQNNYPSWALDDEALHSMFSILGLWFGPMDLEYIAMSVPGILRGGGEWMSQRIMGIQRTIELQHIKMIFEVIKPITMSVMGA